MKGSGTTGGNWWEKPKNSTGLFSCPRRVSKRKQSDVNYLGEEATFRLGRKEETRVRETASQQITGLQIESKRPGEEAEKERKTWVRPCSKRLRMIPPWGGKIGKKKYRVKEMDPRRTTPAHC